MGKIRPDELDARLDDETEPFVLDIRPADHYRRNALDGSFNAPVYDDVRSGDEESLRQYFDQIPRDKEVVVVCKMGIVAKRATKVLRSEGYEATTLAGGMSGWKGYQNGSLSYRIRALLWRLF
ncbi:rhodanese-like domain-containing protein [Haloferax sp. DFSO52]|uniref:rhodanese-like domain-containing protein n=1 Tax=Haloferax sp. DFSO52 TaxID=3388505 RepID=UPI003A85BD6A